jgi:DNA-binding FadR family transcriptional regulator
MGSPEQTAQSPSLADQSNSDGAGQVTRLEPSQLRGGSALESSRNSSDAIAAVLVERIVSGDLAVDAQLPSERRLAADFGASRPMVREALRSLIERGFIDVEPGSGAFVRATAGARGFRPFDLEYRRRGTTARQLSEARLMLETEAAGLATIHATQDDLATLDVLLELHEASTTLLDRVRNDLAFHSSLVGAAHNPVIETMFASIQALIVEMMVRSAEDPEIMQRAGPYHRIAYDAIRARDAIAARAAMQAHLSIAASTYGEDYDRPLDMTAARAWRVIGSGTGLDEFLLAVLPGAQGSVQDHSVREPAPPAATR